jgi:hypothetical protein
MARKYALIDVATGLPVVDDGGVKWDSITWPAGTRAEIFDMSRGARISPGCFTVPADSEPVPPPEEPVPIPPPIPPVDEEEEDIPAPPVHTSNFVDHLIAHFNDDEALDWQDGNVTLKSPVALGASSNKTGFNLNMNEASVFCDYNDPTKHAITFAIAEPNINIREFAVKEIKFRRVTPFAGALRFRCPINTSWIYSFTAGDISCGGHTEHALHLDGSVFEANFPRLKSTNGKGLFRATTYVTSQGHALPSAMVGEDWRPRDFEGHAIQMDSPTPYAEPFDLRLTEGYVVTGLGSGMGLHAPSGLTSIEGFGFENIKGKAAMYLGYRGGDVIRCQGSNPSPNTNVASNPGMAHLVFCELTGTLTLDGCSVENYGSGSGMKLAKVMDLQGAGKIVVNPTSSHPNADDIEGNFAKDRFAIVVYKPKA